jgi:hypothetical protein
VGGGPVGGSYLLLSIVDGDGEEDCPQARL